MLVIGCVFLGAVFDHFGVHVGDSCDVDVGCRLTVDCRVLVSEVVVGSWLSSLGGCRWFLDVGCRYRWL
jgi:hypothetical protein